MAGSRVSDINVRINQAAARELLQSAEVQAELERRGHAIADAAGEGFEVESFVGRRRARVTVRTATYAARKAEATTRALTNALDAGR